MKNSKVGRCVSAKLQLRGGGGGQKDQEWGKNDEKTGCEQILHPNFSLNLKKIPLSEFFHVFRIFKFHRRSTQKYSQAICIFSREGTIIDHMTKIWKKHISV